MTAATPGGGPVVHPRLDARRGSARATSWWGKAWVRAVEEAAYTESDLRAARALSRGGRIGAITVEHGFFVASVEDGRGLWTSSGSLPVLDATAQAVLVETVAAESGRVAALLAGDLPHALVEHAEEAGVELLPFGAELGSACTCQAWMDPCIHTLAVLYQLTWLLEADPFVLLHLRGMARDDLLARLHARARSPAEPKEASETSLTKDDLDTALDAALRAARVLEILSETSAAAPRRPATGLDHLF